MIVPLANNFNLLALKKRPIVTPQSLTNVFIDFETFFSTAADYDLKSISVTEYINDDRFAVLGFSIKVGDGPKRWVWADEAAAVLASIDWSNAAVIAHNAKFDGAILAWKYGINPALWVCTLGMAKAVFGSSMSSYSLAAVARRLGLPEKGFLATDGKTLEMLSPEEREELVTYGVRDLDITISAFEVLSRHLPDNQWGVLDWTIRCFTEPKLELDTELTEKIIADINTEKEEIIRALGVDKKTLSSNKQFAEYLKSLGYPVPTKLNKKGKEIPAFSVQDVAFQEMLNSADLRLKTICETRVNVKQTMEIARAKKLTSLGRRMKPYPFDVGFSGATQTHRFSGGDGAGGNPQNFPKTDKSDLRYAVRVPEGHKLLVADFKNIEWRILSFIARDPELMRLIRQGIDPYCHFGTKIYGREITKADKAERAFGKEAVLGLGYQMGAETFRNRVKLKLKKELTEKEARDVVRLYRSTYTGVQAFWDLCEEMITSLAEGREAPFPTFPQMRIKKQALVLPSGLEVKFPNLRQQYNEEFDQTEWVFDKFKSRKSEVDEVTLYGGKLTENICQALAGEVCKDAIERLKIEGFPACGQVHDELLVRVREDEVEKGKLALNRAMTAALPWWPELILETEIGVGDNWGNAKV